MRESEREHGGRKFIIKLIIIFLLMKHIFSIFHFNIFLERCENRRRSTLIVPCNMAAYPSIYLSLEFLHTRIAVVVLPSNLLLENIKFFYALYSALTPFIQYYCLKSTSSYSHCKEITAHYLNKTTVVVI
jgi:hypothetical protein